MIHSTQPVLLLVFGVLLAVLCSRNSVNGCTPSDSSGGTSALVALFSPQSSTPRSICFPEYGCYSTDVPFHDLPLPDPPEKIPPRYLILELNETRNGVKPREIKNSSLLNVDKLVVMTHGFTGSFESTKEWADPLAVAVYQNDPGVHVLFVEWEIGAAMKFDPISNIYSQPASNTRMTAAIAVKFLRQNKRFNISRSYCIGFSLGAHVCGFMAKAARQKWARLSAIDPAAPLFDKPYPEARVDKSDALFVDVVHTSVMGLSFDVGHVDFYVNNPLIYQPGCEKEMLPPGTPQWLVGEISAYFTCSHYRAPRLFASTINVANPKCRSTFRFCPCYADANGTHPYQMTLCHDEDSQILGFGSFKYLNRRGSFCGRTGSEPPFC